MGFCPFTLESAGFFRYSKPPRPWSTLPFRRGWCSFLQRVEWTLGESKRGRHEHAVKDECQERELAEGIKHLGD
jgi:hypothetical protein